MAAGVFSKVVHFTTPASTGDYDVTDVGITETPKLVILIGGASGAGETIDARFTIGAYDGTDQNFNAVFAQDGVPASNTDRRRNTGQIYRNVENTAFLAASAVSFLSNGVRLNFATTTVGRRIMAIFFWGDDFSGKVGTIAYGTGTSAIAVTGLGFQPNAVLFHAIGQGAANTALGLGVMTLGMAADNSGGIQRRGFFLFSTEPRGAGPGPSLLIDDTVANGELYGSNNTGDADPGLVIAFNSFDAGGFTVTPAISTGSVTGAYIAMRFGGRDVTLTSIASRTTVGIDTISLGYQPEFCFGVSTRLPSFNSVVELGNDASNWSVFAADGDNVQGAQALAERYNTDPTQCNEWLDQDNMIRIGSLSDPGIETNPLVVAQMTAVADGIELNYTTVNATARQSWMFSVEGEAPPASLYAASRFFFN
jgi:hypothetical protein